MAKEKETDQKTTDQDIDPGRTSDTNSEGDEDKPYEFEIPELKGKSKKEVEALFRMSQQVIAGQKTKLDNQQSRLEEMATRPPAAPPPEEPKKDFYSDPDGTMDRLIKRLEDKLDAQIKPLREDIAKAKSGLEAQGLEERMRAQFDDWDYVRPYINGLLAEQNFPNPNDENLLKSLYHMAVGMMVKQGVYNPRGDGKEASKVADPDTHRGPIPQHRSSPPPPPPKKPGAGPKEATWDDLDETERVFCRMNRMTPQQFKDWQNADASDVAESTIGIEKKGD